MENIMELSEIINQKVYNLLDTDFAQKCKIDLDQNGVLTLSNFLNANTLKELVLEAEDAASQAYYCLLYTSPSPRDQRGSRMPSSA